MNEAQHTAIYIYHSAVEVFVGNEKQAVTKGERLQLLINSTFCSQFNKA